MRTLLSLLLCATFVLAGPDVFGQNGARSSSFIPQPSDDLPRIKGGKEYATEQWRLGNYEMALEHFAQAYAEDLAAADLPAMAGDLNQIGLIQWRSNDCSAAMASYIESARLAEQCGLERLLGLTYLNRSILLKNQDLADSAFRMNAKALGIFTRLDAAKDIALALNNEGQIHKHVGAHARAQLLYERSMRLCEAVSDTDGLATAYYNLADVHARQQHMDSAFQYARQGLALGRSVRTKVRIGETLHLLSRLHEDRGSPDSALFYYKAFAAFGDSLNTANKARALAIQQARLGAEVKDLRIRSLQSEKELQRTRGILLLCGLLLTGGIAGLLGRRQWKRAQRRKRLLEEELDRTRQVLNARDRELRDHLLTLADQAAEIQRMKDTLVPASEKRDVEEGEVAELLERKILTEDDWLSFKERFSAIYPDFFGRIRSLGLALTEGEVRYMVLLRLGLGPKEMSELLGISPQSARVGKLRLRKKLAAAGHPAVDDLLERLIA
ncbi:MAG TPA: tetratricopeptide repeat protein [Flavobacteriales bacterium]